MKTTNDTPRVDEHLAPYKKYREVPLSLIDLARKLERENARLRATGNALRDYLTAKVGPIEDIPDEIFTPFCEALKS